jgi:hypothetical protein
MEEKKNTGKQIYYVVYYTGYKEEYLYRQRG